MARWLFLFALLILSGCAEMEQAQREQKLQEVAAEPSDNLCVVTLVRPQYRQLALDELSRRQYQCDWPQAQARAQVYIAQKQANQAAAMNSLQGYVNTMNAQTDALNARAAEQARQNQPINCYSQPQGYGVSTTCR